MSNIQTSTPTQTAAGLANQINSVGMTNVSAAQAALPGAVEVDPAAINPLVLTPEQKQKWQDTMSLMAWNCPGFRHIFYKLLNNNDGDYVCIPTTCIPIAATDGKNILINPETFFKLTLKERVFVMAHEVLHNVLNDIELGYHCRTTGTVPLPDGTTAPYNHRTMNKAMDYRINALLVDSRIGTMPVDVDGEKVGLLDPAIATANDSVYDIYKKIYEDEEKNPGNGGFDVVLVPNCTNGGAPNTARNPQQWAVEINQALTLEGQRSQGKVPAGLARMFKDILEPKVPWTEHIRAIVRRKIGSGSYDWRKGDRRFLMRDVFMPGRTGNGAGWVVVWGDTSGSIGESELNLYLSELSGIIDEVKPKRLTVLWCDSEINQIDELEESSDLQTIRNRGVGGGGGTEVLPVFDWIAAQTEVPDVFIGFTDGHVDFPPMPAFHCIWASVDKPVYPYGDVVMVRDNK